MNSTETLQEQITELNQKVDLILDYINEQRLKREKIDDLIADVSIVSKDVFHSAIEELDKQGCDLDPDELKYLLFKILKNIKNISHMVEMFESTVDLIHDAAPIVHEVGIDIIHKMNEFDQKGYFNYVNELIQLTGQIKKHFTSDDVKQFSTNIEVVVNLFKQITNKDFLESLNKTVTVISTVKMDDTLDNKSIFKLMKELNSPEVKKSLSYTLRIIKEINKTN